MPWSRTGPSPALTLGVLLLAPAAQAAERARLEPAAASVAAEDGPMGTATNPALVAFDPDPGLAVQYRTSLDDLSSTVQANAVGGGTGLGVLVASGEAGTNVALQSTLAARLPHDWTLGANFWWHLPAGQSNNFTAWDLGAGWRPLPWIGLGAVARDIGSPAPQWGIRGRWQVGVVLRPFGDPLQLGVHHSWIEPDDADAAMDRELCATLKIHPVRGLALRAYATDAYAFGAGVELYFGGTGVGAWTSGLGGDGPDASVALFTSDPAERLIGQGGRVAAVRVEGSYPYQPPTGLFSRPTESYLHLLDRVHEAARDRSVRGLLLHLDDVDLSLAQIEELRDLVGKVRSSGRPVVAYLDEASSTAAYYLATAADVVAMHPAADLDLKGLTAEMLYFREALDRLGLEPQFVKRSEFKSGPEPFTRTGPSDAERAQTEALLDDFHGAVVSAVAEHRNRTTQEAAALVEGGPWSASEAQERGLVDVLLYPDDLEEELEEPFCEGYRLDDAFLVREDRSGWRAPRAIAVVVVEGPITSGPSRGATLLGPTTGAETVVEALDQARKDSAVKAVVLRVDSPGGSAFASEDIAHAVDRLREDGKPVVASMGGVAASGGYYVLSGAAAIYAQPSTITGSIGVYSGRFSLGGLYEKIGIDATIFARGRHAAMNATSRPWDPSDLAVVERLVEATYDRFKQRVAEGRNLDLAAVEQVARGRVWSGTRAHGVGLVDTLGGFYDAVDHARQEAGMRPGARYELVTYASDDAGLTELPARLLGAAVWPARPPAALDALRLWSALEGERVLAVMPYLLEVR
ncbi:MAG: signal peptide peptidase SppA [Deltaproteobacteria bacterium]|nr:signal peptide peptidase SppA [Deltaproteobacteria bacterium]